LGYVITRWASSIGLFPLNDLVASIIVGGSALIVDWIIQAGAQGLVVDYSTNLIKKGKADLRESFSQAFSRLAPLLVASLASIILTVIGLVCLVIPGIIILVMFSLILPVVMIEKSGGLDSLGRSRKLVSKRWGKTFAVLFIVGILQVIVNLIVDWVIPDLGISTSIIVNLVSALVKPLTPISTVFLYYSMLQKETLFEMLPDKTNVRYCTQCGKPILVSAIFCQHCGSKQLFAIEEEKKQKTSAEIESEKDSQHLYDQLLGFYSTKSSQPKHFLEYRIENLTMQGLTREEAIKKLAIKEKIIEE
jgi:hypothetical protein